MTELPNGQAAPSTASAAPVHDLVIRGGEVIDGTGAPSRTASVAIDGGLITAVGHVVGSAAQEIDATGMLVTPGFVDIHAHYDGQATWSGRLDPSSWHGVTTLVAGNCGVGFAPVRPADHDTLIELMEGVEDIPGVALQEGLAWDWQSFPEFLDVLGRGSFDADLGVQVPHGPLRLHVMGQRGADREPATADDIARMAALAAEAVEAGAIGFTTSRTLNHRTSKGQPVPSLLAEADELVGIAKAIGATDRGVLQVVSDFADPDAEFALCRQMVEESGRPLSFSLVQAFGDGYRHLLDLLAQANADGLPMIAQVAPRPVGLLLGFECTLQPFMRNPVYGEIAGLSLEERVAALREPAFRARLLAASDRSRSSSPTPGAHLITALERMYPLGDPPDYEPDPSTSVAARAARSGEDPFALALDALLADDGHGFLYLPLLNYGDGNLDAAGEMLAHPNTVVGLADGGAHVGTICDASFPTTLLTHWGRDRAHGRMDLPFLVHRQTQATARAVGFLDRGVLAPGMRADVNVIDHARLSARRPTIRHDLPAGGRRLVQGADGYVATVVAGQVTYEGGVASTALPGRLVRGPQAAPAAVGGSGPGPLLLAPGVPKGLRRASRSEPAASAAVDRSADPDDLGAPVDPATLVPLEEGCEWRRSSIGDRYVFTLTAEHVAELDEALARSSAAVEDVLDITRAHFPLPALGAELEKLTHELVDGRGVVLIRGLPAERLSKAEASAMYWGIGTHLGRPWPQNAKGHLLGDVTDQGRALDDPTARGNEIGGVPFPFHSDGSDLVGLLCLDAGLSGGASLVANAVSIHNDLVRSDPELAAHLYRPYPYDLRGEQAPGAKSWYTMPVFTRAGSRLFVRYIRPYIESVRRHADAPPVAAAARAALDRVDAMCADEQYQVEMTMQPGDMQFVNNFHVLHARRGYEDDRAAGRVRHLKRLWLATGLLADDSRPEPFRLGRTDEYWSRNGKTKSDLVI